MVDGGKFDLEVVGQLPVDLQSLTPATTACRLQTRSGRRAFVTYIRAILLRDTGATLSPFHAFIFCKDWILSRCGSRRHVEMRKIVNYLKNHPQVEAVHHPSIDTEPGHELYEKYFPHGGGSIFTFEIKGGDKTAGEFINNLPIFLLLANVADVKSLVIHPANTTHSQLSATEQQAEH